MMAGTWLKKTGMTGISENPNNVQRWNKVEKD
jgi:hypothetical protein